MTKDDVVIGSNWEPPTSELESLIWLASKGWVSMETAREHYEMTHGPITPTVKAPERGLTYHITKRLLQFFWEEGKK